MVYYSSASAYQSKAGSVSNGTCLGKSSLQNIMIVIPANTGIHRNNNHGWVWIPVFAGMTVLLSLSKYHKGLSLYA